MAGYDSLHNIEGYDDLVVAIDPNGTIGEIIELDGLYIALPEIPPHEDILYHDLPQEDQKWTRRELPEPLQSIDSEEDWKSMPYSFKERWNPYISEEFRRKEEGIWFYNNGVPTYLTGYHYQQLQWGKYDFGRPYYFKFQADIAYHLKACFVDPRCMGQNYVKCRRSGYTAGRCSDILCESISVKEKHLGIQSKTGTDVKSVFGKIVEMFKHYPFFFKPIQEGSTAPKNELSFKEPSKKITKNNKTSKVGEALGTWVSWRNTVNGAYDSETLWRFFLDEAGKFEEPTNILEAWRIQRTCLLVGKKIRGKAMVGSTVNPLDKGGRNFRILDERSDPSKRNKNGRTISGLYRLFISADKAYEGFFDVYGNPVVEDPEEPVLGIDGEMIYIGSRTFIKNEREALKHDSKELNEYIRQYPFNREEAFRESVEGSTFDISKIYSQIEHNYNQFPDPIVRGNFHWKNGEGSEVIWRPDPEGRWYISWLPPEGMRNQSAMVRGQRVPANGWLGRGGVDSYDLDQTVDGRGSNGACSFAHGFTIIDDAPSNSFVAEYCDRPPMAKDFYDDVLRASIFYGYPLLIENNKYGIARYFETKGYSGYLMDRPKNTMPGGSKVQVSRTKGVPSNSADLIDAHARAIESYIAQYVGELNDGSIGDMPFNRTLEDWISFKVSKRTKYDLSISSGLALMALQASVKDTRDTVLDPKVFIRKYGARNWKR